MKAKHLESALSSVADFAQPKWALEQYRTPPRLAAAVLKCIEDDLEGARVLDLGCGTGMLLAGACILGAEEAGSLGVDADPEALAQAAANLLEMGLEPELILGDVVAGLPFERGEGFDVAVMNPPFGTKNQGVDLLFVKRGLEHAPVVYSLHKTSTRDFLLGKGAAGLGEGVEAEVVGTMQFALPATYKFHKQKSVDIEVDLLRFARGEEGDVESEEDVENGESDG